MKRHLVAVAGIALAAALGAAAGCASDAGPAAGEETAAGPEATSPALTNHYYHAFTAPRLCVVSPYVLSPCGGYSLVEVNGDGTARHAQSLDFSGTGFTEDMIRVVEAASDGGLVLYGAFAPAAETGVAPSTFVVREAFRGMPGVTAGAGESFYTVADRSPSIVCITAPCNNEIATLLEKGTTVDLTSISVAQAASMPHVDQTWLADRVAHRGAVVAGHIEQGPDYPGGHATVLDASQVYVRLPDRGNACPLLLHVCPEPTRAVYTRNADRCLVFQGCVEQRACLPEPLVRCAPGYNLVTWAAAAPACEGVACDPAFLTE